MQSSYKEVEASVLDLAPDLKKTVDQNAAVVVDKRREIATWLRRETTLSDEEIERQVIMPLDRVTFRAGYEVGYVAAITHGMDAMRRIAYYRLAFGVLSAAGVAWMLVRFLS